MVSRHEREARNEVRFRDQNEWIDAASRSFGGQELTAFVCECGDGACAEPIELTKPEYEAVRSAPTYFALAVNHENPEVEALVSESARYSVVDKVEPAARRIARETDPRSSTRKRRESPD